MSAIDLKEIRDLAEDVVSARLHAERVDPREKKYRDVTPPMRAAWESAQEEYALAKDKLQGYLNRIAPEDWIQFEKETP